MYIFMGKNEEKASEVKESLANTLERPTSEATLSFQEKDIIKFGEETGYEFCPKTMEKIFVVHREFMPIFENGLAYLLAENEKQNPDYYAFARDGELLFDALWGIGQAGENDLVDRIHYLKTSMGMNKNKNNSKYLKEIGITGQRFRQGPKMVFLDSAFKGSLFHKVGKWASYRGNLPNKNMKGYLVKTSGSKFNQLNLSDKLINQVDEEKIRSVMQDSPYKNKIEYDLNFWACAFMQMMPKFTGRFVNPYKNENGKWDVFPERNSAVSKSNGIINQNSFQPIPSEQYNSISYESNHINVDIVNPTASLLLQKRTLDYFTDPNVHDRISSRIKKKS